MLTRYAAQLGSRWRGFEELPSLFWLSCSDRSLMLAGWAGVGLSALVLAGFANVFVLAILFVLYLSISHVGGVWYGYGWENQLTETGFLATFLCPLLDPRPFPKRPPPRPVIWLFRWLTFRIMLGAGLIKLRGDPCWRDLTCLDYHFLTQPIPNPLSPFFHFLPARFHEGMVLYNHLVEVICPFFVFGPRVARLTAGALMVLFQLTLIASGNLSFLNWLTLIPILACFDDAALSRLAPARFTQWLQARPTEPEPTRSHAVAAFLLLALVVCLSVAPVKNLLSSHQVMNTSHDPLELVNSYGAFGSVGKVRNEIVFEGTHDDLGPTARWRPYEFKCKPGDPDRRPCFVAPYHLRLDWQIWFAAMEDVSDEPWTVHFVWKLLHADGPTLALLAGNPFPEGPPRYIRATLYRYEMVPPGSPGWWRRRPLGEWLPPLSTDDPRLLKFLRIYGWLPAAPGDGDAE
ncbi:MAG TPA: lipase maturation factor family protein [Myxococcales bacterium]|nr:lipase maturation factor family protein [Myxococcales bacterium]